MQMMMMQQLMMQYQAQPVQMQPPVPPPVDQSIHTGYYNCEISHPKRTYYLERPSPFTITTDNSLPTYDSSYLLNMPESHWDQPPQKKSKFTGANSCPQTLKFLNKLKNEFRLLSFTYAFEF